MKYELVHLNDSLETNDEINRPICKHVLAYRGYKVTEPQHYVIARVVHSTALFQYPRVLNGLSTTVLITMVILCV